MSTSLISKSMDTNALTLRARFLADGDQNDLPIIDAHHHFWDVDRNYHPWLRDKPPIPFRYGDYSRICHNFLPADYQREVGSHHVVNTVMMEGEWDPQDPLGEARWASGLAAEAGWPGAMAGQIWLDREDVADVIAAYKDVPLVRSVRHKPRTVAFDEYRSDFAAAGSMRCSRWRDGYARLADAGLMFELQAPWWHFKEAEALAQDFPSVTIVVNHTGLPVDRSEAGLRAWGAALHGLAAYPNVMMKISGLGEKGVAWTAARHRRVVLDAIDMFTAERCMFASNFPVDGVVTRLESIFTGFKEIVSALPKQDQLRLFYGTAQHTYRL